MFWKMMILAAAVLVVGWIGYAIYWFFVLRPDEKAPRSSEQLEKSQKTMDDYAKKMVDFEKKRYDKTQ